jgi:protein TonB
VLEMTHAAPAAPGAEALDTVATARYEQLLVAWLEKHKKYPRRAKRLRIEGEGMLRILINRQGQTQQVTLEQPTGNRLLDKAALEMAQRADPFPPMPEKDPRRELEFMVPVAFVLY